VASGVLRFSALATVMRNHRTITPQEYVGISIHRKSFVLCECIWTFWDVEGRLNCSMFGKLRTRLRTGRAAPRGFGESTPVLHCVLVLLWRVHYHSDRKKSAATSDSSWSSPAQHRRGRACLLSFRASLVTVVAVSLSGHSPPVLF
jgi:hypothetical protein